LVTSKILSSPPTATLSISGASQGRTPSKVELAPGAYDVSVTSGDRVGTFAIRVVEGAPNVWCYDFDAARMVEGRCP